MDDDINIYDDLENFDVNVKYNELLNEREQIVKQNEEYKKTVNEQNEKIKELERLVEILKRNISSLYKTCKTEINRKKKFIAQLKSELDDLKFRRNNSNTVDVNKFKQTNNLKRYFTDNDEKCDSDKKRIKLDENSEVGNKNQKLAAETKYVGSTVKRTDIVKGFSQQNSTRTSSSTEKQLGIRLNESDTLNDSRTDFVKDVSQQNNSTNFSAQRQLGVEIIKSDFLNDPRTKSVKEFSQQNTSISCSTEKQSKAEVNKLLNETKQDDRLYSQSDLKNAKEKSSDYQVTKFENSQKQAEVKKRSSDYNDKFHDNYENSQKQSKAEVKETSSDCKDKYQDNYEERERKKSYYKEEHHDRPSNSGYRERNHYETSRRDHDREKHRYRPKSHDRSRNYQRTYSPSSHHRRSDSKSPIRESRRRSKRDSPSDMNHKKYRTNHERSRYLKHSHSKSPVPEYRRSRHNSEKDYKYEPKISRQTDSSCQEEFESVRHKSPGREQRPNNEHRNSFSYREQELNELQEGPRTPTDEHPDNKDYFEELSDDEFDCPENEQQDNFLDFYSNSSNGDEIERSNSDETNTTDLNQKSNSLCETSTHDDCDNKFSKTLRRIDLESYRQRRRQSKDTALDDSTILNDSREKDAREIILAIRKEKKHQETVMTSTKAEKNMREIDARILLHEKRKLKENSLKVEIDLRNNTKQILNTDIDDHADNFFFFINQFKNYTDAESNDKKKDQVTAVEAKNDEPMKVSRQEEKEVLKEFDSTQISNQTQLTASGDEVFIQSTDSTVVTDLTSIINPNQSQTLMSSNKTNCSSATCESSQKDSVEKSTINGNSKSIDNTIQGNINNSPGKYEYRKIRRVPNTTLKSRQSKNVHSPDSNGNQLQDDSKSLKQCEKTNESSLKNKIESKPKKVKEDADTMKSKKENKDEDDSKSLKHCEKTYKEEVEMTNESSLKNKIESRSKKTKEETDKRKSKNEKKCEDDSKSLKQCEKTNESSLKTKIEYKSEKVREEADKMKGQKEKKDEDDSKSLKQCEKIYKEKVEKITESSLKNKIESKPEKTKEEADKRKSENEKKDEDDSKRLKQCEKTYNKRVEKTNESLLKEIIDEVFIRVTDTTIISSLTEETNDHNQNAKQTSIINPIQSQTLISSNKTDCSSTIFELGQKDSAEKPTNESPKSIDNTVQGHINNSPGKYEYRKIKRAPNITSKSRQSKNLHLPDSNRSKLQDDSKILKIQQCEKTYHEKVEKTNESSLKNKLESKPENSKEGADKRNSKKENKGEDNSKRLTQCEKTYNEEVEKTNKSSLKNKIESNPEKVKEETSIRKSKNESKGEINSKVDKKLTDKKRKSQMEEEQRQKTDISKDSHNAENNSQSKSNNPEKLEINNTNPEISFDEIERMMENVQRGGVVAPTLSNEKTKYVKHPETVQVISDTSVNINADELDFLINTSISVMQKHSKIENNKRICPKSSDEIELLKNTLINECENESTFKQQYSEISITEPTSTETKTNDNNQIASSVADTKENTVPTNDHTSTIDSTAQKNVPVANHTSPVHLKIGHSEYKREIMSDNKVRITVRRRR